MSTVTELQQAADGSAVLVNIPLMSMVDGLVSAEDCMGVGVVAKQEQQHFVDNETDHIVVDVNEGVGVGMQEESDHHLNLNPILTSAVIPDGQLLQGNTINLQALLSAGCQLVAQPNGIQMLVLPATQDMLGLQNIQCDVGGLQLPLPTVTGNKLYGLVPIQQPTLQANKLENGQLLLDNGDHCTDLNIINADANLAAIVVPSFISPTELPPGCPSWAARLHKCQKIGDSYRGYVEDEGQLDLILTLYKRQTNSFWGTRQSPSSAKSSTRLMWKSQYVPFDGIPFVNSGSRAVVMECQYGPRRKGSGKKSHCPTTSNGEFKQTCPARIYVKKVRKFPSYAVNLAMDKKSVRAAMDKAFSELRLSENSSNIFGEERYYVQLPTESAHDYHEESDTGGAEQENMTTATTDSSEPVRFHNGRIHPKVLEKIRQMVAAGESKLYAIRKQLRKFVVCDLFRGPHQLPERHDLTVFPTVNDLKNHIHQAMTDIQNGTLVRTSSSHTPPPMMEMHSDSQDHEEEPKEMGVGGKVWPNAVTPETVTVTLTQNPEEDGQHMISRIETHLSDGTTQVSTTLTPETAQLLARLQPSLLTNRSVQLNDSSTTLIPVPEGGENSNSTALLSSQSMQDNIVKLEALESLGDTAIAGNTIPHHHITSFNPSALTNIVDMEGNIHNISAIIGSDVGVGDGSSSAAVLTTNHHLINSDNNKSSETQTLYSSSHHTSNLNSNPIHHHHLNLNLNSSSELTNHHNHNNLSGLVVDSNTIDINNLTAALTSSSSSEHCNNNNNLATALTTSSHHHHPHISMITANNVVDTLNMSQLSQISQIVTINGRPAIQIIPTGINHDPNTNINNQGITLVQSGGEVVSVQSMGEVVSAIGGTGHLHHHNIGVELTGEDHAAAHTFAQHCVSSSISKTDLEDCVEEEDGDVDGSVETNLESDKIPLHMTTDQELGMARLENKVSIL